MPRRRWPAILLLVALAAAAHGWVIGTAALGHDTYPILAASRVEGPADLAGTFREPYMDGRFRTPYYRPVLALSFALDEALFGLDPRGLQLTSLLALVAAAVALLLLAERLLEGAARGAPLLAALVFLLHPAHVASLPIASRRHDALCFALTAWCLLEHLRPAALAAGRMRWRTGVLALLALGTKETALVLPLAALVAVALYAPRRGLRARLAQGLVATVPDWLALLAALAARFAVLGELGGPESGSVRNLGSGVEAVRAWLLPLPGMERSAWAGPLVLAAAAGLALGAGRFLVPALARARRAARAGPALRAAAFALVWLVLVTLPLAYLGEVRSWRLLFSSTGLSLLVALAARGLAVRLRGSGAERAVAALALAPLAALGAWHVSWAAPLRAYPQWELADDLHRRFLADLERRVEATPDGGRAYCLAVPTRAAVPREATLVPPPPVLLPRSIQAWCELRFPGRAVRLVPRAKADAEPPFPGGVTVVYRLQEFGGDVEPDEGDE